ncbi:hypothetical protein [Bathymodiolus japonicus methanotrophic gill symbiont]|uniref:hypothetical protein n=1 Tax=Bathymodiolus japonicus methanotrophic gill symbiont TaxID=113269 RepID=UPI001C8F0B83|nr:hypothetical protein [Bathymodiolus japonicus methanotrophic gill symbiont]
MSMSRSLKMNARMGLEEYFSDSVSQAEYKKMIETTVTVDKLTFKELTLKRKNALLTQSETQKLAEYHSILSLNTLENEAKIRLLANQNGKSENDMLAELIDHYIEYKTKIKWEAKK